MRHPVFLEVVDLDCRFLKLVMDFNETFLLIFLRCLGCDEKPMKVKQTFLVVFGGMDTTGLIFDDCLGFLLEDQ